MIQFYHVQKRYPNGCDALTDVTLRVREGEFVFLTGPSGAGKSTLLRLLLVMERASDGQILIGGRNIHVLRDSSVPYLRRNIGVVFQDFRLLDHLTTYENVALPLRVQGREEASYRAEVVELLQWVGLGDRMNVLPPVLSGGEKQRVAIARALINDPHIIMGDEPTGNLDKKNSDMVFDIFNRLSAEFNQTLLIVTHDPSFAERTHRIIHMEDGRILT